MNVKFAKCSEAIEYTNHTKTYGMFYSKKQDPNINMHVHECCEVLLCMSGGKNFLINDRIYDVHDGDIFIINPYETHKITCMENSVFTRFVLHIHPSFLYTNSSQNTDISSCFFSRGENKSNQISLTDDQLTEFLNLFIELTKTNPYGDDILKNIAVVKFLVKLNILFYENNKHYEHPKRNNPAIERSIDYINKNYAVDLSLDKIAEYSYISVNQLCRLFKVQLGTTVLNYIIHKRISEAKKLLKNGENVSNTAMLCGFGDYSNFIRTFKKIVGVSPGKYIAKRVE